MKAVQYHDYGDADVLGVDEIDQPTIEPDEVLDEGAEAHGSREP